jgi:hypothetical protein
MFSLFGTKKPASAVVIDISSSSVAGALVAFPDDASPVVPYSTRIPISFPSDERSSLCMLRALDALIAELGEKGIPAFSRATGAHHPDRAFVAIGSPWQETTVESHVEKPGKPFVFTSDLLAKAIARKEPLPEGKKELQKEVIATLLNGYHVTEPFGKRADRAEVIVLSSIADADAMTLAGKAAKRLHPKDGVLLAPFQSVAYEVLRAQYPHDKDFLLIRVSEESTSVMFANRGIVIDAASIPVGLSSLMKGPVSALRPLPVNGGAPPQVPAVSDANAESAWVEGISGAFRRFAERHALPRILFLVADEAAADSLKRLFDTPNIHGLWLSDEPLRVIPVISRLLSSLIKHQGEGVPDATLDLVALFASLRLAKRK